VVFAHCSRQLPGLPLPPSSAIGDCPCVVAVTLIGVSEFDGLQQVGPTQWPPLPAKG
jgi:hypothetical protein